MPDTCITTVGVYQIAKHYDETMTLTWVEVTGSNYHAGFATEDDGTVIETVDFSTHRVPGFPNWDEAGEVNLDVATDPELCREVLVQLGKLERRMDQHFSVFNGHLNDAAKRANEEFIAQFGQTTYDEQIKPFHESGIMSIFDEQPNIYTQAWVTLVAAFVNEDRA